MKGCSAIPVGENDDTINTTFKGALNIAINKLLTTTTAAVFASRTLHNVVLAEFLGFSELKDHSFDNA